MRTVELVRRFETGRSVTCLLRVKFNQEYKYAMLPMNAQYVKGKSEIELGDDEFKSITWLKLVRNMEQKPDYPSLGLSATTVEAGSILGFGMYAGYEVGLIYAFDPKYLEWCIRNVSEFCIKNLQLFYAYGVFRESSEFEAQRIGREIPFVELLDYFKSLSNLNKEFPFLKSDFRFSKELEELNEKKLKVV